MASSIAYRWQYIYFIKNINSSYLFGIVTDIQISQLICRKVSFLIKLAADQTSGNAHMNMTIDSLDDILPFVEKPSRYLGSEINIVRKDLNRVKLRFALAFPDLYEIGTSHFGMQILYHILNADPDIAAERVFAPGVDMETLLRHTGRPLFSLESRESIRRFDIIGFSLLYELNYTNILTILDLAQIPFLASERDIDESYRDNQKKYKLMGKRLNLLSSENK